MFVFCSRWRRRLAYLAAMSVIERYMFRQLAIVAVLVTLTLTMAVWLTQSLRFVELIVNRGLSLQSYLYLTLLLLPSFLSLMLPVSLFTAVLFTYNKLITDSELIVLRAAGLGPFQLARPALVLAGIVVMMGYTLSLYLLPWSYRQFKDLEYNVRTDYSSVLLREGAFNNVTSGITVYIRSREPDGELQGILIHDNRERDKSFTLMAERGRLAMTEEGPRVILVNGNRQQVDPANGKLSLLYFDRYSVDLGKIGQAQQNRWREPRERYLHELLFPSNSPDDRAQASRLRAEAHNRLTTPLLGFAFTLISLAALLSGEFNRRGQSKRVLAAIALAAALQTGAIALGNAIVRWPALTPAPYVVLAATTALCLWWLIRARGRARMAPAAA
jgi:lipopolysaccharide export system permease protein